ncbi:LPXTG cell wall anchor domain-containing protein [Dactylosporangium sp. CA-152071]|uniref:LPXTG cell wall anchor domain-containing protein n=1 Tax=Dactylosporangium sp. CA-152071 TaxID=3239933 RepID=UPI003D8CD9A3
MSPEPARVELPIQTTRLAVTGADTAWLTGLGLALLLTGAGAVHLSRSWRSAKPHRY